MNKKKSTDSSQFLADAYSLDDTQGAIQFYRKWAKEYDTNMASLDYLSPGSIVRLLAQFLTVETPSVLDVGCGTGLTGETLKAEIDSEIDGIDISGEMIEVARSKNIYRNLVVGDLNQPLIFEDNQYDAAICSGTFTHGHVGPQPIEEIFRVLKPGGLFACTVHFDLWHTRGFDVTFAKLLSDDRITTLSLEEGQYFENSPAEGWFCVYQKSADSN